MSSARGASRGTAIAPERLAPAHPPAAAALGASP